MNIGTISAIVGMVVTLVSAAIGYGILKERVRRLDEDLKNFKTNYSNKIDSLLAGVNDLRVAIAKLEQKIEK
jgi:hypothetical protein